VTAPSLDLVSVVIPVRDAANVLGEQLAALARQTYRGRFEVLVVDNGSTDDLVARMPAWQSEFPFTRLVSAHERAGVSHARNVGCRAAHGQLLAICDADDAVVPQWLEAMVDAAHEAEIAGGLRSRHPATSDDAAFWRPLGDQVALPEGLGFLPYAVGCNLAVWRSVFDELGGWSEDFVAGADDIDFSWRAQLAGCRLVLAPGAIVQYRVRDSLRSLARQMYRYGKMRGLLVQRYRRHGARPSPPHAVAVRWVRLALALPLATSSRQHRGRWVGLVAREAGRLVGSIRYRTWAM
jgi:GT2 family glycosyltransferase